MVVSEVFPDVPEMLAHDAAPVVELRPLSLGDVLRAQRRGAQVLDTRSPREFADGHLADSTHIRLGAAFTDWAEALMPRLRRAGFDRAIGFLAGGVDAVSRLFVPVRQTGERSSTAASLLEQTGRLNVVALVGGLAGWRVH